jgi:hypothetical protein
MYVANSGGNNLSVVDLAQGTETRRIDVPAGFSNDTPLSLAVADTGLVLFSTTFAGSGFGGRMLQYDPVSDTVAQRTDFFVDGTTTEATYLRGSGDRSAIGAAVGDISSAPVFVYSAARNVFSKEEDLNGFISLIALDETGDVALVSPGTYVLDILDLGIRLGGTIAGGSFGVAADPGGTIGYRVGPLDFGGPGTSTIDVLDLHLFQQTGTLDMGTTVGSGSGFVTAGVGRMAISRDGSLLAVITDNGISLVQTSPGSMSSSTTTTSSSSTTTTTTVPGICQAATAVESIDCRLGALMAVVQGSSGVTADLKALLVSQLQRAIDREETGKTLLEQGEVRKAHAALKHAFRALIDFEARIRSLSGRHHSDAGTRQTLLSFADPIRTDLRTLLRP